MPKRNKKKAKKGKRKGVTKRKQQTPKKRKENGDFDTGNTEGNRWAPGESGNPAGRPQGPCLKTALRKHFEKDGNLEQFIKSCVGHAEAGNAPYAREIWERTHGKETARVDVTSGGEKIKGYIGVSPDDWDEGEDDAESEADQDKD